MWKLSPPPPLREVLIPLTVNHQIPNTQTAATMRAQKPDSPNILLNCFSSNIETHANMYATWKSEIHKAWFLVSLFTKNHYGTDCKDLLARDGIIVALVCLLCVSIYIGALQHFYVVKGHWGIHEYHEFHISFDIGT